MPRACEVCAKVEALAEINKALVRGASIESTATRFRLSPASVQRHRANHVGLGKSPGKKAPRDPLREKATKARAKILFDSGRCPKCGISVEDTEPQSLLRRAERLMWNAEAIVARAAADDDYRLQLQAIDRVRSSLELVMKAVGMLKPDNSTYVDQRQLNIFQGWSPERLEAFIHRLENAEDSGQIIEAEAPKLSA